MEKIAIAGLMGVLYVGYMFISSEIVMASEASAPQIECNRATAEAYRTPNNEKVLKHASDACEEAIRTQIQVSKSLRGIVN